MIVCPTWAKNLEWYLCPDWSIWYTAYWIYWIAHLQDGTNFNFMRMRGSILFNWTFFHFRASSAPHTKIRRILDSGRILINKQQQQKKSKFTCMNTLLWRREGRVCYFWSWITLGQMHVFSGFGHRGYWQVAHKPSFMCHLSVSHEPELEKLCNCPKVIQLQK